MANTAGTLAFLVVLLCWTITDQQDQNVVPPLITSNSEQNVINAPAEVTSTQRTTTTMDTFGVPPMFLSNGTPTVTTINGVSNHIPSTTKADRRTFFGGGGGGGGGYVYGRGQGGQGISSILTPLAGAAAAALSGTSLLSLPNANIQPTIQKTLVVNMSPHNPIVFQGNAHQPGTSTGQTVNNQYGRKGSGSTGYRPSYHHPPPPPPPPPPRGNPYNAYSKSSSDGIYERQYKAAAAGRSGYVKYENSPSFPQIAGKLGLGNVLNLAKQTGLLENLLIGGPFTFFAPSDEAFTRLPKIFLDRAADNPELLKSMLLYHLVPDTITTRHFTNDLLLPTLNTKKLRINIYQLGYKKIATVNGAVIIRPDQYMINGVIQVIDRVLFPVANGTLLQVMNQPNCQPFDVISTVFAIAGLYDKLDEEGPYTVFLPNTEAFGLVPAEERDKLIQNTTLIKEAFLYHIVPGTYYSQGLNDGQWLETLSTFKVPMQVGMVSDGYSRRFDSVNGAVRIVKADIPAENGVIHIVDRILTPFQTYLPCLND